MDQQELQSLSSIPGLGPARVAALKAAGVERLDDLLRLKAAELASIRGIGQWQARRITEYLRQRGLALAMEGPDGEVVVRIEEPRTAEEAVIVSEAVRLLQEQEDQENRVERELEELAAVMASEEQTAAERLAGEEASLIEPESAPPGIRGRKRRGRAGAVAEPAPAAETSQVTASPDPPPVEPAAAGAQAESAPPTEVAEREAIRQKQAVIPETALALMDAIRAASVEGELPRQLTRLTMVAGEFLDEGRDLSPEVAAAVGAVLEEVRKDLERARKKEAFDRKSQRRLVRRIRAGRSRLEAIYDAWAGV